MKSVETTHSVRAGDKATSGAYVQAWCLRRTLVSCSYNLFNAVRSYRCKICPQHVLSQFNLHIE